MSRERHNPPESDDSQQAADHRRGLRRKRRVALHSMVAAAVMTLLKLAAGIAFGVAGRAVRCGALGLDLVGAALTYFSVQVSDKPADEDHTYGHGKIENLSAFGEAGLMAVSCAWIIWEAMQRIFTHTVELRHSCGRCWCC